MRYQPVYDIAELCVLKNIKQVVLCPGSRCAPLTLAFTRHPLISTKTFSDERSAGFIALGMAQATKSPVVVVCTSGTAAYNLAPSVAEAHFNETPLIIFTADRPAEWIGQHDGQTIHQNEMYGKHVKKYFQLPQDYEHPDSHWAVNRIVNEALNLSVQSPRGPVHVNAPFREPLYPSKDEKISYSASVRVIEDRQTTVRLQENQIEAIRTAWNGFHKVLLVAGQLPSDQGIVDSLSSLTKKYHLPLVHDIISNLHEVENGIQHSDLFLGQASLNAKESLSPDLLITFGRSLVSKNLKIFLRKFPAMAHWQIQTPGPVADTFKSITEIFSVSPESFLEFLDGMESAIPSEMQEQKAYHASWQRMENRTVKLLDSFLGEEEFSELKVVQSLLEHLPPDSNLHLANSMSVRYANVIGLSAKRKGIAVFSNRGTSGIDGCTSTAVGNCLAGSRQNFLITGDLAFFYDRNAFWHNYPLPNLRILLLNNHGGLIFDILEGPSSLPEADEYFITRQALDARSLCQEFGFDHYRLSNSDDPGRVFEDFLTFDNKTKIIEVETDTTLNKHMFEALKMKIKQL